MENSIKYFKSVKCFFYLLNLPSWNFFVKLIIPKSMSFFQCLDLHSTLSAVIIVLQKYIDMFSATFVDYFLNNTSFDICSSKKFRVDRYCWCLSACRNSWKKIHLSFSFHFSYIVPWMSNQVSKMHVFFVRKRCNGWLLLWVWLLTRKHFSANKLYE